MLHREAGLLSSRKTKLSRLRQRGIDPYPPRFRRTCDTATAIARFESAEHAAQGEGRGPGSQEGGATDSELALAGRIMSMRVMGRAAFLDLRDNSGTSRPCYAITCWAMSLTC